MLKVCSLDFINQAYFETDIFSAQGELLQKKGEQINPGILLELYFQEIYIKKPLAGKRETIAEEPKIDAETISNTEESSVLKTEQETDIQVQTKTQDEIIPVEITEELAEDPKSTEKLEFDEDEANNVAELSVKIGKRLNLPVKEIEELKQAAYYHNIGRTRLTKKDLEQKNFRERQAREGKAILLKEKKLSSKIAETAELYLQKCETSSQPIQEKITYAHIVAIANFYNGLIKKGMSKDEALDKMLLIGGNKFNIMVLHKFIRLMQEEK